MTKQEAIKDIQDNIKPIVGGKSLDMAIEALSELDNNSTEVDKENEELSCSEKPNRSDLISRQAAIEVAKKHWYKPDIAGALAELPSALPEPQWIPCEERLPEVYENAFHETWSDLVLVTIDDGLQIGYTTDACLIDGVWMWNIDNDYWKKVDGEVIAWQPLPSPYTQE